MGAVCSSQGGETASAPSPSRQVRTEDADTAAVDLMRQQHCAEVASIREAFAARARAMDDDLQVGGTLPRDAHCLKLRKCRLKSALRPISLMLHKQGEHCV